MYVDFIISSADWLSQESPKSSRDLFNSLKFQFHSFDQVMLVLNSVSFDLLVLLKERRIKRLK